MKNLLILLSILLPLSAHAWGVMVSSGGVAGSAGSGTSYSVNETFETPTTGYEETWTELNAGNVSSINPAYTTTALEGSQSCYVVGGESSVMGGRYISFTDMTSCYIFARVRIITSATDYSNFLTLMDSSGNIQASLNRGAGTTLYGRNGSVDDTDATGISDATTYFIWIEYANTGALDVYVDTDRTKPASHTGIHITTGTSTGDIARLGFGAAKGAAIIFDQIIVSDTVIGDVDE